MVSVFTTLALGGPPDAIASQIQVLASRVELEATAPARALTFRPDGSPPREQLGKPLILVAFREEDLNLKSIKERTSGLGPIEQGMITRNGLPVRMYFYRVARSYLGPNSAR